jgi:hypothetical protein
MMVFVTENTLKSKFVLQAYLFVCYSCRLCHVLSELLELIVPVIFFCLALLS